MPYLILALALANSITGWVLYDRINAFAEYKATIQAESKRVKAEAEAEAALKAHGLAIIERDRRIAEEAKKYETELESLKTESDSALNDAIARLRSRASRCEDRVPAAVDSAEADHSETSGARNATKGMDELFEVDRLIKQYEKVNADYALCLKGYNINE